MKGPGEYVIRISELSEKGETFEFQLEDSFFNHFVSGDWSGGKVLASVVALKRPDGISLEFHLKGELAVTCDLCLDQFPLPVDMHQRLFIKYGNSREELDDDIIVISRDENLFDLSNLLYEYLVLSMPVKKTHPKDRKGDSGCNLEMISKLQKHLVADDHKGTDPRWDDLKKLLDKN